jgi:hypothetical protein
MGPSPVEKPAVNLLPAGSLADPDGQDGRPSYKLYSPGQIGWALATGMPFASALFTSFNYRRLGHVRLAMYTLWFGLLLMVAQAFALRAMSGGRLGAFIAFNLWRQLQRDECLFDAHVEKGGQKQSSWRALGIVALCWMLLLLLNIALGGKGEAD